MTTIHRGIKTTPSPVGDAPKRFVKGNGQILTTNNHKEGLQFTVYDGFMELVWILMKEFRLLSESSKHRESNGGRDENGHKWGGISIFRPIWGFPQIGRTPKTLDGLWTIRWKWMMVPGVPPHFRNPHITNYDFQATSESPKKSLWWFACQARWHHDVCMSEGSPNSWWMSRS